MYYGNVEGSNLCLRGDNSAAINPINSYGAYNGMWRACAEWASSNTFSLCSWSREADIPKIKTSQGNSGNYSFNVNYRYGGRLFEIGVTQDNGGASAAGFSSPFGKSAINGNTVQGYWNNTMASYQNSIATTATATYGYIFMGWKLEGASGTALTPTANVNWYYNSTYGGKNAAYIKYLHASWATAGKPSDRRLKQNIRLIGKSVKGTNIYTWSYKNPLKHGYGIYQGVMAQEVPHATLQHDEGYLMVDYSKVDVEFKKLYEGNLGFRER
jgi:hypothetical protein|tara:strand:- start:6268 stop:7077 length:810 start_codon:yes stop_codon:yes gene_type:complete